MRALAFTLLVICCAAPAAHAAVRPLARTFSKEAAVALAGEQAVVASVHAMAPAENPTVLRVLTVPVAGGRAVERGRLISPSPDGVLRLGVPALDASASTVGLLLSIAGERALSFAQQPFGGPLAAPLTPLGALVDIDRGPYADGVQVDGDRLVIEETDSIVDPTMVRLSVRAPGAPAVSVALPPTAQNIVLVGDLVAYSVHTREIPRALLEIREWRTGRTVRRLQIAMGEVAGIDTLDLLPDGRALVGTEHGQIREIAAGGAIREVTDDGHDPVYAGEAIVFQRDERLLLVGPDGRPRRIGYRSATIGSVVADARRVLWEANGCVVTADLGAPAVATAPPGPCPRSEVAGPFGSREESPQLGRDRRVPVAVRCVAAPAPDGCRGTVRLTERHGKPRLLGRAALRVATGERRAIRVGLTPRGRSLVRRAQRSGEGALMVDARIRWVDRAGLPSELVTRLDIEL